MLKYHYKIISVGGFYSCFDMDEIIEFDMNAPSISITNDDSQTIIPMRNVVRIELTLNKNPEDSVG